jgi:hypothetical protein
MAWAKPKTAIVACAMALLVTGATKVVFQAVRSARPRAGPDIQGAWEGFVDVGLGATRLEKARSRVVLRISKTNDVYGAVVDYIDLGRTDVWKNRLRKVVYDFPTVRFDEEPWGIIEAKLNEDGTTLTLGPEFILERTKAPDAVPEQLTQSNVTPRSDSDLQGCWQWDNPHTVLSWKIAQSSDGTFRGEFDLPKSGLSHWPVFVIYNPPTVKLRIATGTALFQGKISGAEIAGTWYRNGNIMPMNLKRVAWQPEQRPPEGDYLFGSSSELPGHWKAAAPVKSGPLEKQPLDLDIAKLPDGDYSATLTRPFHIGQEDPVPASEFKYPLPKVRLKWKSEDVVFDATLIESKLTGDWVEDGKSHRVTFERSQTP